MASVASVKVDVDLEIKDLLQSVCSLHLKPGDVLVAKLQEEHPSAAQMVRAKQWLETMFPENKILLLRAGDEVTVQPAEPAKPWRPGREFL